MTSADCASTAQIPLADVVAVAVCVEERVLPSEFVGDAETALGVLLAVEGTHGAHLAPKPM